MKKALSFLMCLLFILTTFFPAGVFVSVCLGYTFSLINASVFALFLAALSICVVVLDSIFKCPPESKVIQILLAVIVPISLINAVFYVSEYSSILSIVSILISVGCCCLLTIKHGKPTVLKTVALTVSALMILPIVFVVFISLTFGGFSKNTVTKTVESPNGKYRAEVIDSDQGALGGDTRVDVYEQSGIRTVVFKAEKKPQRVYCGDWGEFNTMQIYWKDDGCLLIDSVEYNIKQ